MTASRSELRTSWKIVLASSIGFGFGGSGLPLYTNGIFAVPLAHEFGWSLSRLQTNILLIALSNIITSPLAGWLCDRFGSRRVALVSLATYSVSLMLLSQLDGSVTRFYGLWLLVALSGAGTMPVVWTRVIVGWFEHARGVALGLTLMGTGFAGAVTPPLMSALIERLGWRSAYVALGLIPLLTAMPLTFLFFKDSGNTFKVAADLPGRTAREAVRSYRFWVVGACLFLVTLAVSGLIANLVKVFIAHGYSFQKSAWIVGVVGVFVVIGRPLCGWLMDRFWAPAVAFGFFAAVPMACFLLRIKALSEPLAILAAALVGLSAAAEFDVIPFLISRYFGARAFGTISGQIFLFFFVASAIGPMAFATAYDRQGNFDTLLLLVAGVTLILPFLALSLGPYVYGIRAAKMAPVQDV